MDVHIGVDKDSGLIDSVETIAVNGRDLTPATDPLHGEEKVVYQGIEQRAAMEGRGIDHQVAVCPGKRRALTDTPEGRLNELIVKTKAAIRAKAEPAFRVTKHHWLTEDPAPGMISNRCNVKVVAAPANLFMIRHRWLGTSSMRLEVST